MKRGGWYGPTPYSVLCSKHFTIDCYPMKYKILESTGQEIQKKWLLPEAIPTIHPSEIPVAKRSRMEFTKTRENHRTVEVGDNTELSSQGPRVKLKMKRKQPAKVQPSSPSVDKEVIPTIHANENDTRVAKRQRMGLKKTRRRKRENHRQKKENHRTVEVGDNTELRSQGSQVNLRRKKQPAKVQTSSQPVDKVVNTIHEAMPAGAVPFPFGKCRICRDQATGMHYGVITCEGCKGFFKRSTVNWGEKYKCFFGGHCDVTPKNRNRCKSCRFKLCLATGMSFEAVRMGRIPKREKQKALRTSSGGSDELKMNESIAEGASASYLHMPSAQDSCGATTHALNSEIQEMPDAGRRVINADSQQVTWSVAENTTSGDSEVADRTSKYMVMAAGPMTSFCSDHMMDARTQGTMFQDTQVFSSTSGMNTGTIQCGFIKTENDECQENSGHVSGKENSSSDNVSVNYISSDQGAMFQDSQVFSSTSDTSTSAIQCGFIKTEPIDFQENSSHVGSIQCGFIKTEPNDLHDNPSHVSSLQNSSSENVSVNYDFRSRQNDKSCDLYQEERHFASSDQGATIQDSQVFSSTPGKSTNTLQFGFIKTEPDDFQENSSDIGPIQCGFIKTETDDFQDNPSHVSNTEYSSLDNLSVNFRNIQRDSKLCDLNKPLKNSEKYSSFLKDEAVLKDYDPESAQLIRNTTRRFEKAFNALYDRATKDKRRQIKEYFENQRAMRHSSTDPEEVKVVWGLLLKAITESVNNRIVSFCSEVPGFINLCPADRAKLTKRAYLEIWLLTAAEFFQDRESYLIIGEGIFYSRATMCAIMNEIIVDKMFDFAEKLNSLILADFEIAVLCAIQLTTAEGLELDEPEAAKELNSHYLDVLAFVVNKDRPVKGSRLLIDLFRLIPHLVEISKRNSKVVEKATLEGPTAKFTMSELE